MSRKVEEEGGLHRLIISGHWPEVLRKINPASAAICNKDGDLALHVALENRAPIEVLTNLLQAYPDAAREVGKWLQLPIHIASREDEVPVEFVRELLRVWPESAQVKFDEGSVPLLLALEAKAPLEVLVCLHDAYPEAAETLDIFTFIDLKWWEQVNRVLERNPNCVSARDEDGNYPLHVALEVRAPYEILSRILFENTDVAMYDNDQRLVPLQVAVQNEAPIDIIEHLLELNPQGARDRDGHGNIALHLALQAKASFEVVLCLLNKYPEGAKVETKWFGLPLRLALRMEARVEIISLLLNFHRDAARVQNITLDLPLHDAAKNKASFEVISALIDAYPEGKTTKNRNGVQAVDLDFPLHHACRFAAPIDHILGLLQEHPELAAVKDKKDRVPLQIAAANIATTFQVIEALLAAYPQGITVQDFKGELPLHAALKARASLDVLSRLLKEYPLSAEVCDKAQWLPLHTACFFEAPFEFIAELLTVFPQGARSRNEDAHIPLTYALSSNEASRDVLLALLLEDLPYVLEENGLPLHQPHHCFSWTLLLDTHHRNLGASRSSFFVKKVLTKYPSLAHTLAHTKDEKGREAINICDQKVRAVMNDFIFFLGQYDMKPGPPLHKSDTAVVMLADDHSMSSEYRAAYKRHPSSFNGFCAALDELGMQADEIKQRERFGYADTDRNGCVSEDEFCDFCTVQFGTTRRVAVKFCKVKDQFERELASRQDSNSQDGTFVFRILKSYSCDDDEMDVKLRRNYLQGLARLNLSEYRYCIVLPAADRGLDEIIKHEGVAGRDFRAIRNYAQQIALALQHLHSKERIHGDVKPLNIMREGDKIKLIDLDASAKTSAGTDGSVEFAAKKYSTAFVPPELLELVMREAEYCDDESAPRKGFVEVLKGVPAHTSQDMWQFGCVLFHLCSGFALWTNDTQDNVDADTLFEIYCWNTDQSKRKFSLITEKGYAGYLENKAQGSVMSEEEAMRLPRFARSLCSQLLATDPHKRPASIELVLAHPFFTGRPLGRLPGEEPMYDVFVSHRWNACDAEVECLYQALITRGLRVFLDNKVIKTGDKWERKFCDGLASSRIFVPVLSSSAIKKQFESLSCDDPCDNVLLEHRLALELEERHMVEKIIPLLIGDQDAPSSSTPGAYCHFFEEKIEQADGTKIPLCAPSPLSQACVASVEAKLVRHLERLCQGAPLRENQTVAQVFAGITSNIGELICGSEHARVMIDRAANNIAKVLQSISKSRDESDRNGSSSDSRDNSAGGGRTTLSKQLKMAIAAKEEAETRAEAAEAAYAAATRALEELRASIAAD